MSDEIEITREDRHSTYSWDAQRLDSLREFVDSCYAVGAIGDEMVEPNQWRVRVMIASDDLMPKPGRGPVTVRRDEFESLTRRAIGFAYATAFLGIAVAVLVIVVISLLVELYR